MLNRILPLFLLIIMAGMLVSCGSGLANGNLIGTVVREGSGELIQRPHLIIGRQFASPITPAQSFVGDLEGKFEITIPGGNYIVQISASADGPFYTWPDAVYVAESQTTIALFQLPADY